MTLSNAGSQVCLELGSRSYTIHIDERLMAKAGKFIAPLLKSKQVIIISDETVARLYLHRLTNSLEEESIRSRCVILPVGEKTKSLAAFGDLMEMLLEQKPDRQTTLIALGGGVIGDLTGFAASVLLRGVDFIQIPTTLLAQVDSSVGGKTGINSAWGKNLIGSFHQPLMVLADTSTLASLPHRQVMAGYAEMLKYGLINDLEFYLWLEQNAAAMLAGDALLMQYAIGKSCMSKATIVAGDEREAGNRALLNFGHTFAHVLEAETGFGERLLHGEAVAIGMILAFRLSVAMGLCPAEDLARLIAHYETIGLPSSTATIADALNIDRFMDHFSRDKKVKDGKLTFILVRGIGKAFITQEVNSELLRQTLAQALVIR